MTENDMIKTPLFGPSGHSEAFFNDGNSSTMQMPKWLSKQGLELFEYSFGRGVNISSASATEIGKEAEKYGIEISVHAPYFINFASPEPEKAEKSIEYLLTSLKILKCFGGKRCVFHPGAETGRPRAEAFARVKNGFAELLDRVSENPEFADLIICPETMGKGAQVGTIDEVAELCNMGENVFPCVDFGHINALYGGNLKTSADFDAIAEKLLSRIGERKTKNMHVHFSKIEYGAKGEIRHLTFADNVFGPEFEPFAKTILKYNLTPHILSESAGTQSIDALEMKSIWKSATSQI